MASLEVPVMRKVGPGGPSAGGEEFQVEVWDSTCKAIDQGNAAAEWLGEFLERVSELSQLRTGGDGSLNKQRYPFTCEPGFVWQSTA